MIVTHPFQVVRLGKRKRRAKTVFDLWTGTLIMLDAATENAEMSWMNLLTVRTVIFHHSQPQRLPGFLQFLQDAQQPQKLVS